jgi:hypothetical protein
LRLGTRCRALGFDLGFCILHCERVLRSACWILGHLEHLFVRHVDETLLGRLSGLIYEHFIAFCTLSIRFGVHVVFGRELRYNPGRSGTGYQARRARDLWSAVAGHGYHQAAVTSGRLGRVGHPCRAVRRAFKNGSPTHRQVESMDFRLLITMPVTQGPIYEIRVRST